MRRTLFGVISSKPYSNLLKVYSLYRVNVGFSGWALLILLVLLKSCWRLLISLAVARVARRCSAAGDFAGLAWFCSPCSFYIEIKRGNEQS